MTAGFLQLTIKGEQDVFLTGNPQITFFKSIYKKYSKFSIQNIIQDYNGTADFNNTINISINKSGDLLKNIYLHLTLPDLIKPDNISWLGYTNNIGCSIIDKVILRINDQIIETIYGDWIDIYHNINDIPLQNLTQQYNSEYSLRHTSNIPLQYRECYIPLPLFFTKQSGLALPLIALNNSYITLDITFKNLYDVIKISDYNYINKVSIHPMSKMECNIWGEYIYIDEDEKKKFANFKHEYLIEQLQFNGSNIINKNETSKLIELDFRHPVKELIWTISTDNTNLDSYLNIDHNNITKYTTRYSDYKDTFNTLSIQLNNLYLVNNFKADYFRNIQPYYYYKNIRNKYIYSYSFSLHPKNPQPSGYLNFSEINKVLFTFTFNDSALKTSGSATNGNIRIYAINYNILHIHSGQSSLQYYMN